MTELHETEIDGVRCFWVDSNRPTLRASLMFRQGQADETLTESGWLHLLEHIALHGRGGGSLNVNGSVSFLETTFDAHGPAAKVAEHLASLSNWLHSPDLDRFEHERDVLSAEASTRGGPALRAFGWRYGTRGPGLTNLDELGIGRATSEALEARAHRVFTRGNAVLVLDGPPPDGLSLGLREGERLPPTNAVPCNDKLPAAYQDDAGVVMSGVVKRSMGALFLPYVLERMLHTRLREDAGAAYAPWSTYQPVDSEYAVAMAGSDVASKMHGDISAEIARMVKEIRDTGLPVDVITEAVEQRIQALYDPYNVVGLAYAAASYVLDGEEPKTFEQIVEETREISAVTLQPDVWAFTESLLVGLPSSSSVPDGWEILTAPTRWPRKPGMRFRHRDWPAIGDELHISDTELEISSGGYARSMYFHDVEGMISHEDGGRYLLNADGWSLGVEPTEWIDGERVVAGLDKALDVQKHLPRPKREFQPPARMPTAKRWLAGAKRAAPVMFRNNVTTWAIWLAITATIAANVASVGR